MLITKVELEDVKSHRHSTFEFARGTTAITGANGAGKTTIIEAIAWALFDFLEYNRDDFVRRGAKRGAVRITFQSGLDDKLYTVYRDTAGKHWVYDEESKSRIAEQSKDVVGFLKKHWQVEPGTNLKELYRAAIGVPQGTFTAVFLDNATTRKAVFDRLLKVEEYRESAKKLGETANLIKHKQSEVRERLARAEGELAAFEQTENEHQQVAAEIVELERLLADWRGQIEIRSQTVAQFEAAKMRLETARNRLRETQTTQQNVLREQATVRVNRDAAQQAAERLKIVEPDYRKYLAAESELKALEAERVIRDRLKHEKNQIEKDSIDAKARSQFLGENLAKAVEAAREAAELAPRIIEQEQLESEYKTLLEQRAEANAAKKGIGDLEAEIIAKRTEWKELSGKIKDGEKGAQAEAQISELEQNFKKIDEELTEANKAVTSLGLLQRQKQDAKLELEKLTVNQEKIETEIMALEKLAVQAARVGELTEVETSLAQKIADLRAAIELDAKFRREVKNGVCPIMPDRCLNVRESEVLTGYLNGKSTANVNSLKNFESERDKIAAELKAARDAEKNVAKLQLLREQNAALQKQIREREATLDNIRREIAALAKFTPEKHNELRVEKSKIELELKVWREAAKKFAALEGLRRQIQNLADEGKKLGAEQQKLEAVAKKFDSIEEQIAINQKSLRELNNPKARTENLRQAAARENELQQSLAEIKRRIEKLENERDRTEAELSKFAALDEKLRAVRDEIERTRAARDEFLQSQIIAEKLPELTDKLAELDAEATRLSQAVDQALAEHEAADRDYNPENHLSEKAALDAARTKEAATNATLSARKSRETQLREMLDRLSEVRVKMHDDLQEQEHLRKVWETTDYIRETLKKAAPHVGEILRIGIAKEATNLFREITGEVGRSLKWTEDYEILLDENGYQRPFANLSGGEQMAAALSIRLALLTELSDVRIAFFDEPTTNLDRERRERLAQQIGQIRNFNQLFVISHDDTFESNVDFQINVNGTATQ